MSCNNASGVFNITGTNVTISGLTITNGNTSLNGAGINAGGAPGSTLAIDNCVVVSNLTTSAGGGGGIYNSPGVTMTISNCTLSLNRASSGFGGGIFNDRATLIVVGSTLSANYGTLGGGIGNNGSAGTAILMVKLILSRRRRHPQLGPIRQCDADDQRQHFQRQLGHRQWRREHLQ